MDKIKATLHVNGEKHNVLVDRPAYAKNDSNEEVVHRHNKYGGYAGLKKIAISHGIKLPKGDHSLDLSAGHTIKETISYVNKYKKALLEGLKNND